MSITWKQVKNNAQTTLVSTLAQSASSMTVADATALPTSFPFYATIWDDVSYLEPGDDPNMEIVLVTGSLGGNELSITRGQEGTSDVGHDAGARVANLFTAGTLTQVQNEIDRMDYAQIIDVDPINGDYNTIKDAIDAITDNSSTKPYVVRVHPGVYIEDNPITMKDYVSIVGERQPTVIIKPNNPNTYVFEMANYCELADVLIDASSSNGITAIVVDDASVSCCCVVRVSIRDCDVGLLLNNSGTHMCCNRINVSGTFDDVLKVISGELDVINVIVNDDLIATNLIKAEGSSSKIDIFVMEVNSPNIVNAVHVDDGATAIVMSSQIRNTTNALRIGSTGQGKIEAMGVVVEDSAVYDLLIESSNGVFEGYLSMISRDKLSIASGASYSNLGYDNRSDSVRVIGDFAVGKDDVGSYANLGEGGFYDTGVTVLSYDGSSYSEVTNDNPIQFPNTLAGTALYFGNINLNKFYAIKYTMGDNDIDLGSGSIVWEYYDSGAGSWVEVNTMNIRSSYSDSWGNNSFIGDDGKEYEIHFDSEIDNGITESNSSANGWHTVSVNGVNGYWVRCRIVSNIATSPKISNIRFGGNFMTIRPNGTTAYYGNGRLTALRPAIFGDNNGTAADYALNVSPNITYAFRNNTLANNSSGSLYWRIPITEDMDTSSGIKVKFELCTNVAPGASTYTAKLHFFSAILASGSIFDGTAPEVEQAFDFVASAGDVAFQTQVIEVSDRVDISFLVPGDTVYCQLTRYKNEAGDDLPGNVILSNVIYEYVRWQDGIRYEN